MSRDAYSVVHSDYPEHINPKENCRYFVGEPLIDESKIDNSEGYMYVKRGDNKRGGDTSRSKHLLENERQESCANNATNVLKNERYYGKALGLTGHITRDEVKRRYKDLCQQYHPDIVDRAGPKIKVVAEREMKEINEAYGYFRDKYGIQ
jgi:hypothetical protein